MHQFTEEEIVAIEKDAAKRFDGRSLLVELPEFDLCVVVAPFDREAYAEYQDDISKDPQTAYRGALLKRLLFPDLVTVEAHRQKCAMLPEHVAKRLSGEAGADSENAAKEPLDIQRLPDGLDRATAERLVKDANGARLWAVQDAMLGLSCVMQAPIADTWIAAKALYGDALSRSKGLISSVESYVMGTVVWSKVPLLASDGSKSGLLDAKPALFWDLWGTFKRMGGDGTVVRTKSLRSSLQRPAKRSEPAV